MDSPTTLLVAIMYVTIISIGLSNLLMVLSELAASRKPMPDKVHLSWLLLLLFGYLGFFWQTTEILSVENWQFVGFVGMLIGPVVLLFGTNLIIDVPGEAGADRRAHYLQLSPRFFLMMVLLEGWLVGLDVVAEAVDAQTWLAGVAGIFALMLMLTKSYRLHQPGAIICWVLYLAKTAVSI